MQQVRCFAANVYCCVCKYVYTAPHKRQIFKWRKGESVSCWTEIENTKNDRLNILTAQQEQQLTASDNYSVLYYYNLIRTHNTWWVLKISPLKTNDNKSFLHNVHLHMYTHT